MKSKTLSALLSGIIVTAFLSTCTSWPWLFSLKKTLPEMVYDNCLKSMKDNTCAIMQTPVSTEKVSTVLVAGFGPLDFSRYKRLREMDLYMCTEIKNSCEKSGPHDDLCQLGKTLYLSPGE